MSSSNTYEGHPAGHEGAGLNICSLLRAKAGEHPHKDAVIYAEGTGRTGRRSYGHITYGELEKMSDRCAWGLEQNGIRPGTKVILLARPNVRFLPVMLGLMKIGGVPVVVDAGMGIRRMLGCLAGVEAEAFIGIPLAQMLRFLFPRYFRNVRISITMGKPSLGGYPLERVFDTAWKPYPIVASRPGDPAAIMFTTGSTGPAKGVPYTHEMMLAQAEVFRSFLISGEDMVDLATYPMFALYDMLFGATTVLPDMDPLKPAHVDPAKILGAISDNRATHMFASPALLNRVGRYAQGKPIKLPSLQRVLSGGAPVSTAVIERILPLLPPGGEIYATYGATECLPLSAQGSREILSETAEMSRKGLGSCVGMPLPGLEARIIRITDGPVPEWSDDLSLPSGEIGEIVVRGAHVSTGYYQRPEADALGKIADRGSIWHRMGDVGWLDAKGRIWFCGRKNHRVATPKGTLFTIPCEAVFNNHPKVARSALVGIEEGSSRKPVICIELEKAARRDDRKVLVRELLDLGRAHALTREIGTVLIYPGVFPVDVRHNAKIFREELASWAGKRLHVQPSVLLDVALSRKGGKGKYPY